MSRVLTLFLFSFCLLCSSILLAQDQLIMTSGSVIQCKVTNTADVFIEYEQPRKNGKVRQGSVSRYEVFSIVWEDGREEVIYQSDSFEFNEFGEERMRAYVNGQRDARKGYRGGRKTFWIGLGVGALAGYAGQGNYLWTFGAPIAYTGGNFIPYIRIREETMGDLNYKFNNDYALGYERVGRTKLLLNGLKGSALGSAVGTATFLIFED